MPIKVTIKQNLIPKILANIFDRKQKILQTNAEKIVKYAKQIVAVDTSSLQESLYYRTNVSSTYAEAASLAKSVNPKAHIIPEIAQPDKGTVYISSAVEHADYIEFGTRYMPAQPFLTPAISHVQSNFIEDVKGIINAS